MKGSHPPPILRPVCFWNPGTCRNILCSAPAPKKRLPYSLGLANLWFIVTLAFRLCRPWTALSLIPSNMVKIISAFAGFSGNGGTLPGSLRGRYLDKVAARLQSLARLSASKRYEELLHQQPWVFELAEEEDIASYLRISVGMLKEMGR